MVLWWVWLAVALVIVGLAVGAGVVARRVRASGSAGPVYRAREVGGLAAAGRAPVSEPEQRAAHR
jgi:hypothetical protein